MSWIFLVAVFLFILKPHRTTRPSYRCGLLFQTE